MREKNRKSETSDSQNMHSKHRERLKTRFINDGLDSFEDHNILELLLFFGIPRRDTNPLAHRLLNRFGTLAKVMDAPIESLYEIKGMTKNAAIMLKLIPQIMRAYATDKADYEDMLVTAEACGKYLHPYFFGTTEEMVFVVGLDSKCSPIECVFLCRGDINSVHVNPRKVMEIAFRVNASAILLAHNHPGGTALMSDEDISVTKNIKYVLGSVGIPLIDHIVLADDGDFISMKESGII